MIIDRSSPLPLYYQLKESLLERMQKGEWKKEKKLPTEEEIERDYQVSRTTVRQALRELELEGRITRHPGRGTFITQPKIREGTESFTHLISEVQKQGVELEWQVLQAETVPAPEEAAARLQIDPGQPVFCLRRLRLANGSPIGCATSYVSQGFSEKVNLSLADQGGSMNYIKGIDLEHCMVERIVEALPIEAEEASILELERGQPVLVISRLLRDPHEKPVEYFRGIYRGDRFQYHIEAMPATL